MLCLAAVLHPRVPQIWRRRSPVAFYAFAACLMFVLALGPTPRVFGVPIFYKAPYAWLMRLPGGGSFRVPARFEMLVVLCLAATAALTYAWLTQSRRPRWLLGTLAVLIVLDGWMPKLKVASVPPPIDFSKLPAGIPVLQLPADNLFTDAAAMLQSTQHRHPLVNGYSGYLPPHYFLMQQGLAKYDPDVVQVLREFGDIAVMVDATRDEGGKYRRLVASMAGSHTVVETPQLSLYTLPRTAGDEISSAIAEQVRVALLKGREGGQRPAPGSSDTRR
jgi:hypothetical protein